MRPQILSWDARREIHIPGDKESTITYATEHFIKCAQHAIKGHDAFFVALSGGSTPKALFEKLSSNTYKHQIDWTKVHLFWSDERSVGPEHPDSNYKMAMDAGLAKVGIPSSQIHRMEGEVDIQKGALKYEKTIKEVLKESPFDFIMLGMGDDGHTASLFPHTEGLKVTGKHIIANYVPQKSTWRMTMSYDLINSARCIAIYVLGENKKEMVKRVFTDALHIEVLPIQGIGTKTHPALWIVDSGAAQLLI